ncbi:hypothetical protein BBJ28_00002875 [Nothophytophthora sp. Chile5]|nr:hypothetical protein BBJ28_00002875 [Nothophytophthora sp. Chile5]
MAVCHNFMCHIGLPPIAILVVMAQSFEANNVVHAKSHPRCERVFRLAFSGQCAATKQTEDSMALQGNVAVITRLHDAVASAAVKELKQANPQVTDVTVVSVPEASDVSQTIASRVDGKIAYDAVVTFNEDTALLSAELSAVLALVKAGGVLQLHIGDVEEEKKVRILAAVLGRLSSILMALLIGGLVDATDSEDASPFYPEFSAARCFSSKKPSFESGSSAAISLTKKSTTAQPIKKCALGRGCLMQIWRRVPDTLLDDTDEVLQAAKNDCGETVGGKKRACKNCTCGLKDEEDQPVMSEKDLNKLVSGCGNVRADAFRCGSCPFLGMPAFKPGMEQVLLNLDNSDDI